MFDGTDHVADQDVIALPDDRHLGLGEARVGDVAVAGVLAAAVSAVGNTVRVSVGLRGLVNVDGAEIGHNRGVEVGIVGKRSGPTRPSLCPDCNDGNSSRSASDPRRNRRRLLRARPAARGLGLHRRGARHVRGNSQPYWDAELCRLKAESLLQRGDESDQEAERLLRRALDISERQHASTERKQSGGAGAPRPHLRLVH